MYIYIYIPMWEKGANGRRQRKDLNYERRKGLAIFEEKKEAKEKNKQKRKLLFEEKIMERLYERGKI